MALHPYERSTKRRPKRVTRGPFMEDARFNNSMLQCAKEDERWGIKVEDPSLGIYFFVANYPFCTEYGCERKSQDGGYEKQTY